MKILNLILILSIFFSCNNSKKEIRTQIITVPEQTQSEITNERLELIPEPDKEERLKWEKKNKELLESCFLQNPDSSVAGICIDNTKSTLKVLGKDTKLGGDWTYRNLNKDKSQFLNLTIYPGSYYNQVSLFEVGYTNEILKGDRFLENVEFSTEKGIKLGMTNFELIEIFGECYKVNIKTKDSLKISYRIELPQDTKNEYLSKHNMPIYYADYDFVRNKLNRFEFGFEYP